MPRLRALLQQNAPKWVGVAGLFVFFCCVGCALSVYVSEMVAAPPVNVQEADLVGVWKASYKPQDFYDFCDAENTVITEILTLKADSTYEQKIEKGDMLLYHIEGRRWWIDRVAPNSVRLHLEGGRFYPEEIRFSCLCDYIQRHGGTPPLSCERESQTVFVGTMDRAHRPLFFDPSKEIILPLYRPLFSKEVFLEYLLGDPDDPTEVRFYRFGETGGSEK